ncbi:MAG: CARDB domain-containing protein [Candidatus Woesearchaeota archaeon]
MRRAIIILMLIITIPLVIALPSISINSSTFNLGDKVVLSITDMQDNMELRIIHGQDTYQYLGMINDSITFVPRSVGNFTAGIFTDTETAISTINFSVHESESDTNDASKTQIQKLSDAKTQDTPVTRIILDNSNLPIKAGVHRLNTPRLSVEGQQVLQAYLLEQSPEPDTGVFTARAKGNKLYSCTEWDSYHELCVGNWQFVRNITPGAEYTVALPLETTVYMETGLATINTDKSVYHPNDPVIIFVAVLDKDGHLSAQADVTILVTASDGTIQRFSTLGGSINYLERGIYGTTYSGTSIEGTYSIDVSAYGFNVNSSLSSDFLVQSSYPFEIQRSSPMTTDPWRENFTTEITVTRLAGYGPFNLTETIPSDLLVIDANEGIISEDGTKITWTGLESGRRVSYTARSPLRTPELIYLGPVKITYDSEEYIEPRQWLLAVDPIETLNPIVHANTVAAGSALTSAQVGYISTDDTNYVSISKNQQLTAKLSSTSQSIESVNDIDCKLVYRSDSISPAGTFQVRDSLGGNILGSATVPQSVGVDTTVYANNVHLSAQFQITDVPNLILYVINNDGGGPDLIYIDDLECTIDYTEVDIVAPTVTLNTPITGAWKTASSVTFYYTPNDNRVIASCRLVLDGALNAFNSTPITKGVQNSITSTLTDGTHTWTVNCTDTTGNVGTGSPTRTVYVDTVYPTTPSLQRPLNNTFSSNLNPTFNWSIVTETNFGNYTLQTDTDPAFGSPDKTQVISSRTTNTYTFGTILTSNTVHYWRVIAKDLAGQTSTSQTYTYTTDTINPAAFSLLTPATSTISTSLTPTLDWQDSSDTNFHNYTIQFDDSPLFTSIDHTYSVVGPASSSTYTIGGGELLGADKIWNWRVIAYDKAGRLKYSSQNFTYTTDNTGPTIDLQKPDDGITNTTTNTIVFTYNTTDILSGVSQCQLIVNGSVKQTDPIIAETIPQEFSEFLSNGYYEWWISCTDTPGNTLASAHRFITVSVTVDTSPPNIVLNRPLPAAFVNTSSLTLNYTVQDATGIENCSLTRDGAANGTDTAVENNMDNFFVRTFTIGYHTWKVSCYDNSTDHNFAQTSTRNFTVDVTPPAAFSLTNPTNGKILSSASIALNWTTTADTNFKNYTIVIDDNSDFSSPMYTYYVTSISQLYYTTGSLSDGTYYWRVTAYDKALNSYTTTSRSFTVDTVKPAFSNINANPSSGVTFSPSQTYKFNTTIYDLHFDKGRFENNLTHALGNNTPTTTTPLGGNYYYLEYSISGLSAGNYVYRWYANDTAQNLNKTSQYAYSIAKAAGDVDLYVDGTRASKSVNESKIVNLTARMTTPTTGTVTIRKDGTILVTGATPRTSMYNFSVPGYYNISASYAGNTNYTASTETWFVTVNDTKNPQVNLISPANQSTEILDSVAFKYNVSDSNTIANCSLYINGTYNDTHTSPSKDTTYTFTKSLADGNYAWYVSCIDGAYRTGNSKTRFLTVNNPTYNRVLLPKACSDSDGCTVSNINTSNNGYDSHGTLLKTPVRDNFVYVNVSTTSIPLGATINILNVTWEKYQTTSEGSFSIQWQNGTIWQTICSRAFVSSTTVAPDDVYCNFASYPTRIQINAGLRLRANFYYTGTANSIPFGSDFVAVRLQYTEDRSPPLVILDYPESGAQVGAGSFNFNYTPSDVNLENCTLYGDFSGSWATNITDINPTNAVENTIGPVLIGPGFFTWNVMCVDIAENIGWHDHNHTLNITPPDLVVTSGNIAFSPESPIEDDNVVGSANVFNEGLSEAEFFVVRFFNGSILPANQIGTDQTITNLAYGSNKTVNVSFTGRIGPQNIFVQVDSLDNITESYEDNNEANSTLHVTAYQTVLGNVTNNIILDSNNNDTLINFFKDTGLTGTVYFADHGSDVNFITLQALGRNINGISTTNDFSDLDTLLGMSGFNDSITKTWTNSGTPKATDTFNIYGETILNVPIISSSQGSSFVTGILWDMDDDDSFDTEFTIGDKEDIVFVTKVSQNTTSMYGTYDYEAKVPALIRQYKGPGTMLDIYVELR